MTAPDGSVTFSIRLSKDEKNLLDTLARSLKAKPAVLSRKYILEGIERSLDPVEIDRHAEEEKKSMQKLREAFHEALSQ